MKFKIAICDDEQNQIDYMASIVASWSAHAGHNCEIRTFASAEAFLFEYEEDKAFDILLLDIEMENMGRSLKAQFKQADRLNSKFLIILNDEDIRNKTIKIKDNVTKEETTINEDELVDYINMNM